MSGSVPSWVTAAAAVVALFVGLPVWLVGRRSFRREMVSDLFGEYSTKDMGQALALLHKEFREATGLKSYRDYRGAVHRDLWVRHYVRLYRQGEFELHWARRRVSQFFQRIAYAANGDSAATRIAKGMWGATENFMVLHILLPIENIALPEIVYERPKESVDDYNPAMKLMHDFWRTTLEQSRSHALAVAAVFVIVLACALSAVLVLLL